MHFFVVWNLYCAVASSILCHHFCFMQWTNTAGKILLFIVSNCMRWYCAMLCRIYNTFGVCFRDYDKNINGVNHLQPSSLDSYRGCCLWSTIGQYVRYSSLCSRWGFSSTSLCVAVDCSETSLRDLISINYPFKISIGLNGHRWVEVGGGKREDCFHKTFIHDKLCLASMVLPLKFLACAVWSCRNTHNSLSQFITWDM